MKTIISHVVSLSNNKIAPTNLLLFNIGLTNEYFELNKL